ncbi:hypothetical protein KKD57_05985 [Patescibacteria group bacterium]|nr:hypothetical protein [Patescibacteria group bacterium]
MLADFPEAKKIIKKTIDLVLQQKVRQNAPLFNMINKKMLHEGNKMGALHANGRHIVNDLQHVQSGFTVAKQDIQKMNANDLIDKVSTVAEDMAGQIERGLFKSIDESIKESGNVIPGNPELSPESILSALEKVSIDFDDDDRSKPVRPSLFAAQAAVKKLMESDAKTTPEEKEIYKKKEKAILDKKYEDHLKDLESRKIVD